METENTMRSASIVRFINHGTNIQLLCTDERGLLSIYLSPETFASFNKKIHRSGLKLAGLLIKFDRFVLGVPALGDKNTFPLVAK